MLLSPRRRRGARGRGQGMGTSKRGGVEPTHDWQLLLPLFGWPEQERYEQIRPLVLFDASVAERAAEVGTSASTLYRRLDRFAEEGMESLFDAPKAKRRRLPPAVGRLIVDLKAEYPAFNLNEIANVVRAAFGTKPDVRSVGRVLEEEPVPLKIVRNYPPYHEARDVREARAAVVELRLSGWSVKAIAGYLGVHHATVYRALERWKEKGFEGLADGSPGRPPGVRKADFAAVEAIRRLAQNPGLGAFRVHAAMRQMGFDLSRATCGRILAQVREVYGYEKPAGGGGSARAMPFAASGRHEVWSADVRHLDMVDAGLVGGKAYSVTVMDNYSRAILASAVTRRQDLSAFLSDYNAQAHFAHQRREDGRRSPGEVLSWVSGMRFHPKDLERAFFSERRTRTLDGSGYATLMRWRLYAEEGLAGKDADLWLLENTLTVEHAGEPLSSYEVAYDPSGGRSGAAGRLLEVRKPTLFETPFVPGQMRLFGLAEALGEDGWLKVLWLEDYAPRRARPEMLQQVLFALTDAS